MRGRNQFHQTLLGCGEEDIKVLDVRVPTPLLEQRENPPGVGAVIIRAHVVRARGDSLHVAAQVGEAGESAEFALPIAFRARGVSGKTVEEGTGVRRRGRAHRGVGCTRGVGSRRYRIYRVGHQQDGREARNYTQDETTHREPPAKVCGEVYRIESAWQKEIAREFAGAVWDIPMHTRQFSVRISHQPELFSSRGGKGGAEAPPFLSPEGVEG